MQEDVRASYEILGLRPGADPKEVKQAYRDQVKQWHPDQFNQDPQLKSQAEERIKQINLAYQQLKLLFSNQDQLETPTSMGAERAYRTRATKAEAFYESAAGKVKQGLYREAIADLGQAIRLNPIYVEAYRFRGFAYSQIGYELQASSDLNKANQLELERSTYTSNEAKAEPSRPAQNVSFSSPGAGIDPELDRPISTNPEGASSLTQIWGTPQILEGHHGSITAAFLSRNNKLLISAGLDGAIHFWNLKQNCLFSSLEENSSPVLSLAITVDGQILASGYESGQIKLWHIKTGALIRSFEEHSGAVYALAFSPNRQFLASGGSDKRFRIWRIGKGQVMSTFVQHTGTVRAVAFSPDGQIAITGSEDGGIYLWDMERQRFIRAFLEGSSSVLTISVHSNDQLIAAGDQEGCLRIGPFSKLSIGKVRQFYGHADALTAMTFSPDGQTLLTGSHDGVIKFWVPKTGDCLGALPVQASITALTYGANGTLILAGDNSGKLKIWQRS